MAKLAVESTKKGQLLALRLHLKTFQKVSLSLPLAVGTRSVLICAFGILPTTPSLDLRDARKQ